MKSMDKLIFEGRTLSWPDLGWGAWTAPYAESVRLGEKLEGCMKEVFLQIMEIEKIGSLDGGYANLLLSKKN